MKLLINLSKVEYLKNEEGSAKLRAQKPHLSGELQKASNPKAILGPYSAYSHFRKLQKIFAAHH